MERYTSVADSYGMLWCSYRTVMENIDFAHH